MNKEYYMDDMLQSALFASVINDNRNIDELMKAQKDVKYAYALYQREFKAHDDTIIKYNNLVQRFNKLLFERNCLDVDAKHFKKMAFSKYDNQTVNEFASAFLMAINVIIKDESNMKNMDKTILETLNKVTEKALAITKK